ncbi:hypothetical protein ACOME3_008461 [Neoechinorhynchus agilis]
MSFNSKSLLEELNEISIPDRSLSLTTIAIDKIENTRLIASQPNINEIPDKIGAPLHVNLDRYKNDRRMQASFISHRFIPNREKMDFERGYMILQAQDLSTNTEPESIDESVALHAMSQASAIEPGGILHTQYILAKRRAAEIRHRNEQKRHLRRLQQRGPILIFEHDAVNNYGLCSLIERT